MKAWSFPIRIFLRSSYNFIILQCQKLILQPHLAIRNAGECNDYSRSLCDKLTLRLLFIRRTKRMDIGGQRRVSATTIKSKHFLEEEVSTSLQTPNPLISLQYSLKLFYKHSDSCKILTMSKSCEWDVVNTVSKWAGLRCQPHQLRIHISRSFTRLRWAPTASPRRSGILPCAFVYLPRTQTCAWQGETTEQALVC